MLKLLGIAGTYVPALVCEECKQPIKSIPEATTFSKLETTDTGVLSAFEQAQITQQEVLPEEFDLAVVHKHCAAKYHARTGAYEGFSLNDYFYWLLANLKLNPDQTGLEKADE